MLYQLSYTPRPWREVATPDVQRKRRFDIDAMGLLSRR
jgi:hypothetical protein